MVVQARENECSVTSRTGSERALKIDGPLPGLPHLADVRMPHYDGSALTEDLGTASPGGD
jgi:hypothetical protein